MSDDMSNEDDLAQLWCKLTAAQRTRVMNLASPYKQQVREAQSILTARALERMGLGYNGSRTTEALADWARTHGYAQFEGKEWTFTAPSRRPWSGRLDQKRLVELAEAGWYATQIAKELDVSREAVRQAALRLGLTLAPKPPKPTKHSRAREPRVIRRERLAFSVSAAEKAAIQQAATQRGVTTPAYLRGLCAADTAGPT